MTRPHILIFGCGPMPCEPDGAVMAPGARTWQILRTVTGALGSVSGARVSVVCLEGVTRPAFAIRAGAMGATVYPLSFEDYCACEKSLQHLVNLPEGTVTAVVGCASVQPCTTAVAAANRLGVPVWADVFGDPISEVQSAAAPGRQLESSHESKLLHVWSLLTRTLMGADRFSALSRPQRLALVGQLGCVGRLNAATACQELVQVIPYGLWPDDLPPLAPLPSTAEFRVMWSGSFNTWTDPETLSEGVSLALREEQSLHLEVLGGAIANYHEGGYARFRQGLEQHGAPMDRISLLDWQAYRALPDAYARCHAGLSLDRWTYEAVLGSRTRVVHMLAAGRPVVSTAVSELTRDMAEAGVLIPVETGHARSLADGLLRLARMNRAQLDHLSVRCRQVAEDRLNAAQMGQELGAWVREPKFAADHPVSSTNALVPYWREALVDMTS